MYGRLGERNGLLVYPSFRQFLQRKPENPEDCQPKNPELPNQLVSIRFWGFIHTEESLMIVCTNLIIQKAYNSIAIAWQACHVFSLNMAEPMQNSIHLLSLGLSESRSFWASVSHALHVIFIQFTGNWSKHANTLTSIVVNLKTHTHTNKKAAITMITESVNWSIRLNHGSVFSTLLIQSVVGVSMRMPSNKIKWTQHQD